MALPPGTFVGPYEIVALLGAGNMGEVYRARDAHLKRDIAIKVLPAGVAADPDAIGRFRREAETASALNHPHIVHIYDIGEANLPSGPTRYIAMELVPGGSMRARLQMGDRWAQLLAPLAQVCDALASAHRANIVHRDLKPANIMITGDGYAKVVDFGLAKLIEERSDQDLTAAADRFTETGKVIGTIGYMSPEQARGEALDHRSDIFAIGCILYEVLCGQQPFKGSSTVATLHAIAYDDPRAIVSINKDAPEALCAIAAKCLEKDPARRYQSAGEIAHALRAFAAPSSISNPNFAPTQTESSIITRRGFWRRPAVIGLAVVVGIGAAVALGAWLNRDRNDHTDIAPVASLRVEKLTNRGIAFTPAISADGRYLAYSVAVRGEHSIWVRDLVDKNETRLVGTVEAILVKRIRFSADGRFVYYAIVSRAGQSETLFKIPLIGGDPILVRSGRLGIASPVGERFAFTRSRGDKHFLVVAGPEGSEEKEVAESGRGDALAWSADGKQVLFVRDRPFSDQGVYLTADDARGTYPLFVVNADGTGERQIAVLDQPPEGNAWWNADGTTILLTSHKNQRDIRLVGVDVATGQTRRIGEQLWPRQEGINAVFWLDARRFLLSATHGLWMGNYPDGKLERLSLGTGDYDGFAISADGSRLVAVEGGTRGDLMVSDEPDKGAFQSVATGTDVTFSLGWTPDGRIVYSSNEAGSYDLYTMNRDGSNRKALTFDRSKNEIQPAPTPDGQYIVFVCDRSGENGLCRINADGTGLLQLTTPAPQRADKGPQITPDSKWVLYWHWDNGPRFFKLPIDGGTPVPVRARTTSTVPGLEESGYGASASPDQTMLAFFYFTLSSATRQFSKMTVAISSADGKILHQTPFRDFASVGDHESVQWSADGRAVYYSVGTGGSANLWKWPIGGTPVQFTHLEGRVLDFGWSADGKRMAVVREQDSDDIVLVTNFR